MFTQIMVSLDGSALSEAVLPYAARIAAGCGAKMTLTTAVAPDTLDLPRQHQAYVEQVAQRAETTARRYLDAAASRLRSQGLEVQTDVVFGPPAEALAAHAEESGADLLAMSTHGRSGLGRWMFGSVTDRVLHLTRIPMLIIRPSGDKSPPAAGISTLIVPLDGSPLAESVLPVAQDLAGRLGLRLILAQAVQLEVMAFAGEQSALLPVEIADDLEAEAQRYLDGLAAKLQAAGVTCSTRLLRGPAASTIADLAAGEPDSLVAMSTHGRSGVERAVLGSVADRVIRSSGDAVLVIRPTEA